MFNTSFCRVQATDGGEVAPWAEGVALGGSDLRILLLQQLNAIGQMRAGGGGGNGGATRVGPGGGAAMDATDAVRRNVIEICLTVYRMCFIGQK